jgi:hypothetical protein
MSNLPGVENIKFSRNKAYEIFRRTRTSDFPETVNKKISKWKTPNFPEIRNISFPEIGNVKFSEDEQYPIF